jgi:hypothetical protein
MTLVIDPLTGTRALGNRLIGMVDLKANCSFLKLTNPKLSPSTDQPITPSPAFDPLEIIPAQPNDRLI